MYEQEVPQEAAAVQTRVRIPQSFRELFFVIRFAFVRLFSLVSLFHHKCLIQGSGDYGSSRCSCYSEMVVNCVSFY